MSTTRTGRQRTALATVVSNKMDKTVVVEIERLTRHPLYGKVLLRSTKLKAHDENNDCRIGDRVEVTECRPLSKTKHWRVSRIVARAE